MKRILISMVVLLFCGTALFAGEIQGKWKATIETDNGPFSFTAEYKTEGEKISGTLSSDMGSVTISEGVVKGDEFEYSFYIENSLIKHKGKLVNGELKIKSSGDYGESEFTMTPVKQE